MTYNRVFNAEEQSRIKHVVDDCLKVTYEVEVLSESMNETIKAIAEEMDIKASVLKKAIKIAHKQSYQDEADKFDALDAVLDAAGHRQERPDY